MNPEFTPFYALKDRAKNSLEGRWGQHILSLLVLVFYLMTFLMMLSVAEALLLGLFTSGNSIVLTIFGYIGNFLLQIMLGFARFGFLYYCLKLACRQQTSFRDVLYGLRCESTGAIAAVAAVRTMIKMICFLPMDYFDAGFVFNLFGPMDLQRLLYILISLGIGYAVFIPFGIVLDMSLFVLLDFPEKSFKELIPLTLHLMKGHKKRFFLLQCNLIPVQIYAYLSFMVGMLWALPFTYMTYTMFYLDLMKSRTASESH